MKNATNWLLFALLALNISGLFAFHLRLETLEKQLSETKMLVGNIEVPVLQPAAEKVIEAPTDRFAAPVDGTDAQLNALKEKYETAMVLWLSMKKCSKATASDYHIINSNLAQDMATINAPGRLQYDVLTAAQGSFEALYAHAACEGEAFSKREAEFRTYIETLTNRSNLP